MQNGYVSLWRKSLSSTIFGNEKGWKIWCWCLMKANFKENTFLLGRTKITIKEGEFVMGLNKASEELNLAKSTIHYWLEFLEREGQVELKKTNKYTIVKLKNWSEYQGVELKRNSKKTLKETNNKDNNENKNITANAVEEVLEKKEYNQQDKINEFKLSPRRDVRIATLYLVEKKMNLPSEAIFMKEFLRAMKEVKFLKDFDDETIWKGFKYCKEKYPEYWTIETIYKSITKNFK